MNIHEFGKENKKTVVLIHPLGVWWDVFSEVIDLLKKDSHLIIPAIPGHDPDDPGCEFSSIEEIASDIGKYLDEKCEGHVDCLYGCSMGGACVIRMLAEGKIRVDHAIIDGGITPYRLPKPITYLIGIRDYCMVQMGRHMSLNLLKSVFDPEKYSDDDLGYIKKVLSSMSSATIWRGFYSTNNYSMPDVIKEPDSQIQYWYGEKEKKARKWDIAFVEKVFPKTEFIELPGQDHAEFFSLHPQEFADRLKEATEKRGADSDVRTRKIED